MMSSPAVKKYRKDVKTATRMAQHISWRPHLACLPLSSPPSSTNKDQVADLENSGQMQGLLHNSVRLCSARAELQVPV